MEKYLYIFFRYKKGFTLFVLCIMLSVKSYAAYTMQLIMYENGSQTSAPLCVNNNTYYYMATVLKGGSDEGGGSIYINFKGSDNNVTILTSIAVTSGQYTSGISYSTSQIELNISLAPANRDNGEIYAEFDPVEAGGNVVSSSYITSAPYITIFPSSASLNTETGPTSVALTASSTSTSNYSWSPSSGLNVTTGANVTAAPGTTKVYVVTATNTTTGCTGVKTVTVTVTGPCCSPTKAFSNQTIVTDNVSNYITASGSSSMVATSTVNLKAGNYIILDPDVSLAPSSGVFLAQITACTYNACRIGNNNDESPVEPVLLNTSFIDGKYERVKIYPNPSSGIFMIKSEDAVETVTVANNIGEIVYTGTGLQVDLSSQLEGIYFIAVSSKGKTEVKKVFKNR